MARGRHQEVKQFYRLCELLQLLELKQLSAEVSGSVKEIGLCGDKGQTIKRHRMNREQLCWL